MKDKRLAYGSAMYYGEPDLETPSLRFWLSPDPTVYSFGSNLLVPAYENEPWGRGGQLFNHVLIEDVQRVLDFFRISSTAILLNRTRVSLPGWSVPVRLRAQLTGYADLYEMGRLR